MIRPFDFPSFLPSFFPSFTDRIEHSPVMSVGTFTDLDIFWQTPFLSEISWTAVTETSFAKKRKKKKKEKKK